jgi:hypothetical protein
LWQIVVAKVTDEGRRPEREEILAYSSNSPSTPLKIAIALWVLAVLWCLLYYAPWGDGMFSLLRLKLFCVTWTSEECRLTREMDLKNSSIPPYTPLVWWLGVAAALYGLHGRRGSSSEAE